MVTMFASDEIRARLIAFTVLGMMLVPALAAAAPTVSSPSHTPTYSEQIGDWWEDTPMDKDGDYIHDAIWIAAQNNHYQYLDDNGRISVIVDFDHTPTESDQKMLESELDFHTQFKYWLIDSIAGTVELDRIYELVQLPGVVFVELDGRLEVQMEDVVPAHGVDLVWQDTGYTGAGVTMAIIDTGIDGNHTALDDLDDDNSTDDPKVIAFFDAIKNPGATNGS